jgi:hypothetical protein
MYSLWKYKGFYLQELQYCLLFYMDVRSCVSDQGQTTD